ncbi:MAG TPA: allophanate hydrolase [Tepidisphaeraceae bacterium]|jgi:allophanate hydrolase|nr:allophanate hydrolase [Tepidisphaeraceae bacterium]
MSLAPTDSLDLQTLSARYRSGAWTPQAVLDEVLRRIEAHGDSAVWIDRLSRDEIMAQLKEATARRDGGVAQPLLGVPFAVKDNIDVAGRVTTAACPDYAYRATRSATVVEKLCSAGAILVGKTNLDQFATGLVGTRSPYGVPRNPFDARYIPGGSSSGSGAAVAAGLVCFALGTDTAGSGRVPAAFNNIVGLKPTRGLISAAGLVPACQSLDCVSVFSLTCADAGAVFRVAAGYDSQDPYSRDTAELGVTPLAFPLGMRFGVPADEQLRFYGNSNAEALYRASIERVRKLGGTPVQIDFEPFVQTSQLLYDGPWLAERLAGLKDFIAYRYDSFLPVTRTIINGGRRFDAVSTFDAMHELQSLSRQVRLEWEKMDVLLLPTTGTVYTLAEVEADPVRLNATLGYYTNFVNLLDLCAVAVPAGMQSNGMPAGVTLIAPPGREAALLTLAERFHRDTGLPLGATGSAQPAGEAPPATPTPEGMVRLAVVGAHLSGEPLNHQLTSRNARLVRACKTFACYRLYALPGTMPPKPGLVRAENGCGTAIEVEVWEMTADAFGNFVAAIPPPLSIGTLRLEDGEAVKGFLCENYAAAGARDISSYGGWRKFQQMR